LPLFISFILALKDKTLLFKISTVILIFNSNFSYLFLSTKNLLATLSAKENLKF
jgi:hypothetical protein